MDTVQREAIVQPDGSLTLLNLPFAGGSNVRVLVMPAVTPPAKIIPWEALQGTLVRYDDPFEPAAPPEEWEALQ